MSDLMSRTKINSYLEMVLIGIQAVALVTVLIPLLLVIAPFYLFGVVAVWVSGKKQPFKDFDK